MRLDDGNEKKIANIFSSAPVRHFLRLQNLLFGQLGFNWSRKQIESERLLHLEREEDRVNIVWKV